MADDIRDQDIKLEKNLKILVNVDEAMDDIIVVSFIHQGKVFQGALLNSSKKNVLPCGIVPPKGFLQPPVPPPLGSPKPDEPPLSPSGLAQRFTYFQEKPVGRAAIHIRRPMKPPRKALSKMTVRLRPRQVLCSKCKSICTENSENVDVSSRTTRSTSNNNSSVVPSVSSSSSSSPETRATRKILNTQSAELNSTSSTDSSSLNGTRSKRAREETPPPPDPKVPSKIKIVGNYWISPSREEVEPILEKENNSTDGAAEEKMVLRKKRSIGSMEDLWDESVFEDGLKKARMEGTETRTTTPVIKISFGSSGTVVKIPAKVQLPDGEENSENNYHSSDVNKAAKKALKKAKKETRRKMFGSPSQSPTSTLEAPRRHKHKVKHRKKHKERRDERWVSRNDEDLSAIKEQCLKQRLSISLKRLNENAYMRCDAAEPADAGLEESTSPDSSSPDCSEEVPDFPASALEEPERGGAGNGASSPQRGRQLLSHSVQSCVTADGRTMTVGDVVWGKIHGFPWWPGKVLSISVSPPSEEGGVAPRAHVAWYASSTSSLMPCDALCPFLDTFKVRYNKKKRGPYKEAIRQATTEAQLVMERSSASPSQLQLSVTSSPREVNVFS